MSGVVLVLNALPALIAAYQAGEPVVQSLIADAESEFTNLKNTVVVAPATIQTDVTAMDTADNTLQAAQPGQAGTLSTAGTASTVGTLTGPL